MKAKKTDLRPNSSLTHKGRVNVDGRVLGRKVWVWASGFVYKR